MPEHPIRLHSVREQVQQLVVKHAALRGEKAAELIRICDDYKARATEWNQRFSRLAVVINRTAFGFLSTQVALDVWEERSHRKIDIDIHALRATNGGFDDYKLVEQPTTMAAFNRMQAIQPGPYFVVPVRFEKIDPVTLHERVLAPDEFDLGFPEVLTVLASHTRGWEDGTEFTFAALGDRYGSKVPTAGFRRHERHVAARSLTELTNHYVLTGRLPPTGTEAT